MRADAFEQWCTNIILGAGGTCCNLDIPCGLKIKADVDGRSYEQSASDVVETIAERANFQLVGTVIK